MTSEFFREGCRRCGHAWDTHTAIVGCLGAPGCTCVDYAIGLHDDVVPAGPLPGVGVSPPSWDPSEPLLPLVVVLLIVVVALAVCGRFGPSTSPTRATPAPVTSSSAERAR